MLTQRSPRHRDGGTGLQRTWAWTLVLAVWGQTMVTRTLTLSRKALRMSGNIMQCWGLSDSCIAWKRLLTSLDPPGLTMTSQCGLWQGSLTPLHKATGSAAASWPLTPVPVHSLSIWGSNVTSLISPVLWSNSNKSEREGGLPNAEPEQSHTAKSFCYSKADLRQHVWVSTWPPTAPAYRAAVQSGLVRAAVAGFPWSGLTGSQETQCLFIGSAHSTWPVWGTQHMGKRGSSPPNIVTEKEKSSTACKGFRYFVVWLEINTRYNCSVY